MRTTSGSMVCQHVDLKAIANEINAQHEHGVSFGRKSLEHYRNAGELLLKAKRHVGHGHWMDWTARNLSFAYQTARSCMLVAKEWERLSNCTEIDNLTDALLFLAGKPLHALTPPVEPEGAEHPKLEADPDQEQAEPMPHVARNSGDNEWYTPPAYLDATREVLGDIDLDPASSPVAQERVNAAKFYTKDDDGLTKPWRGKVYMNPPYASHLVDKFTDKLVTHYKDQSVTEAIVLVNNATETNWFQTLAKEASAICFPDKRVKFLAPDGTPGAPLQGQAVLYLGRDADKFASHFSKFGIIR